MPFPIAKNYLDSSGNTILSGGSKTVFVNKMPIALVDDPIVGHGENAHAGPSIMTASHKVFHNNRGVCRLNDPATCGHPTSTSSNVYAG